MRQHAVYLVPDLYAKPGGIARYCRMVCRVLTQIESLPTVISLNDPVSAMGEARRMFPMLRYIPCSRSHSRFVTCALRSLVERPTLVIVGHPNFVHLGWVLARFCRAALIVFMYGIDAWAPLPPLRRFALRRADTWLAISRFTAQLAAQANDLPLQRIQILHNCLDPAFRVGSPQDFKPTSFSVLTVARMSLAEQYKGHDQVIRALPAVLEKFPNLIYDIIGDGDGRPAIEELVRAEGITDSVRFHGAVSDDDLAEYYTNATLFVMPSRLEGFGFVFLEAMAYGKPVVAGNVDATVEVVQHGKTGLLVDPCKPDEIAEAITLLLTDEDLRQRMGAAAQAVVATDFSFERFRHTLLGYLRQLSTERKSAM